MNEKVLVYALVASRDPRRPLLGRCSERATLALVTWEAHGAADAERDGAEAPKAANGKEEVSQGLVVIMGEDLREHLHCYT